MYVYAVCNFVHVLSVTDVYCHSDSMLFYLYVARQCTLYVHTMRDQAALDFDSKVEVIFDEMPGQVTTKMIKEEVLRKLNLTSDNAKKCFSIWITSPYLRMSITIHSSYYV